MNPPFSDREAGEVLARLSNIAEAVMDLRRDLVQLESRFEIALQSMRTERQHENDKLRGELGRRIDDISVDVKELSGYRWRLVGIFIGLGVAWTLTSGLIGYYIASQQ